MCVCVVHSVYRNRPLIPQNASVVLPLRAGDYYARGMQGTSGAKGNIKSAGQARSEGWSYSAMLRLVLEGKRVVVGERAWNGARAEAMLLPQPKRVPPVQCRQCARACA